MKWMKKHFQETEINLKNAATDPDSLKENLRESHEMICCQEPVKSDRESSR